VAVSLLCASNRATSGANASLTLVDGTEQGNLRRTNADRLVGGSASRLNGENKGREQRYEAHLSSKCGWGIQVVQNPAFYPPRANHFRKVHL
jgi:hypothetical protein